MGDWAERRGRLLTAAAAVGMLALLLAGEFYQEDEPLRLGDVVFEVVQLALLVGSMAASVLLLLRTRAQAEESRLLREDVEAARAEGRRWREEMGVHLQALGTAIRRQFGAWRLTAAEQEVGLLLLKGLSHKEIARVRGTGEATIR
jgi:DNA-binding NarL/FixJ family response regulator